MGSHLKRIERHVLGRLKGTSPSFRSQVRRQLSVLTPLLDIIEGDKRFPPMEQVDPDAVKRSILSLFGRTDLKFTIRVFSVDDFKDMPLDKKKYVFLIVHAGAVELRRVTEVMGDDNVKDILLLFDPMTNGLANALVAQFSPFVNAAEAELRLAAVAHYSVFFAAFIGSVMLNDDESVRRLAPMVRVMAQAIVIGAPIADPASWNVLCAGKAG